MMLTQWPMTHQWPQSQWEQTLAPTAQLAPSMHMCAIVPVMTLEGQQNALQKNRPVNI